MTPDRGAAPPSLRGNHIGHQHALESAGMSAPPSPPLLDAVAAARLEYARQPHRTTPSNSGRLLWVLLAALLVGGVTAFVYPVGKYTTATFAILGDGSADRAPVYRQALLNFAWLNLNANPRSDGPKTTWWVDAPSSNTLRWWFAAARPAVDLQEVHSLATAFVAEMADEARTIRETPSEAETALTLVADSLHDRLMSAQNELTRWAAQPSPEDPRPQREQHLAHWSMLQAEFLAARDELLAAASHLQALEARGEPTQGIVEADERRTAQEADLSLQQDLRELHVHLSELKLQVLKVWQQSAAPLERWTNAAHDLVRSIDPAEGRAPPEEATPEQSATLADEAQRYTAEISSFAETWNREFAVLRRAAVDPLSGEIIETHERLAASLTRFLFDASKRLARLREVLRAAESALADDARQYVRYSRLARAFENAQNAHHRFEFAAGSLTARDHYALDSAWRAAAGLRRRTQQRLRVVEDHLLAMARQRAVTQHQDSLADARKKLAETRQTADALVDRLVAAQSAVNLHVEWSEDFLQRTLAEDAARRQNSTTAADIDRMEQQRQVLSAKRLAHFGQTSIALIECAQTPSSSHWPDRARVGLFAGLACLLILGPAEFWLRRTRR